jgi:hypothetical protein
MSRKKQTAKSETDPRIGPTTDSGAFHDSLRTTVIPYDPRWITIIYYWRISQ